MDFLNKFIAKEDAKANINNSAAEVQRSFHNKLLNVTANSKCFLYSYTNYTYL